MIVRLEGVLETVEDGAARVGRQEAGLTYEVLVSSYTAGRLGGSIGGPITLHTIEYFESLNQGTTLIPRLVGFETVVDRRFFELFTTCKGIGQRKALRALTLESSQIAAAIADRDATLLQSLPEIGKRTAETIIATLYGKVDEFLTAPVYAQPDATQSGAAPAVPPGTPNLVRDALHILVQWGENRAQALQWIDRAMHDDDRPGDVEMLIERVYQIKSG